MFDDGQWTFETSLSKHDIISRLRDAALDAHTDLTGDILDRGSRISFYEFGKRLFLVRWQHRYTWLGGARVRAYSWCRMSISGDGRGTVTFDFGRPRLQRLLLFSPSIVPLVLFLPFVNVWLGRYVNFWAFAAAVVTFVLIAPAASQAQLDEDRQALLEWAMAVLDLGGVRQPSAINARAGGETSLASSEDFHPDVGAAMARQYKSPLKRYLIYSAVIGACLWGFNLVLEPAMPALVRWVPVQWETGWGRSLVNDGPDDVKDPVILQTLSKIGNRLLEAAPGQPYHFEFRMKRSRQINAYAAPGGEVVILSGLISATQTPDELAGVMAHEIQHVLNRHSLQELGREQILNVANRAAYQITHVYAGGLSQNLLTLKFSRREEAEADEKGVKMLAGAGLDPSGLLHFFERLREPSSAFGSFLANHPLTKDRIDQMKQELKSLPREVAAKPLDIDWNDFSRRVRDETRKATPDSGAP